MPSVSLAKWRDALCPWFAVCALWLLFELPMLIVPDGVDPLALRPTGEWLLVMSLAGVSFSGKGGRAVRYLLVSCVVIFLILRIDRAIFFVASRAEPLLYDQLLMVRHFLVLLSDLWGKEEVLVMVGAIASLAGSVWLTRRLLRSASALLAPPRLALTLRVTALLWVAVVVGTVLGPREPRRPWVRWITPALLDNLAESRRIYTAVRAGVAESPYRRYDELKLQQKPDVLLIFVESYGKLIAERADMRGAWTERLERMQARLSNRGWLSASAYSTAPISGGRSWLAVGSILMGTPIQYEAVHRQLLDEQDRVPTLDRFLTKQGYETVRLSPSDRSRIGMRKENHVTYDHYLQFTDLDYRGPHIGWGIVPDQYALEFTRAAVLAHVDRPLFFHFHMVSSHAPWKDVPSFVDDWRTLNVGKGETPQPVNNEMTRRLKRYSREDTRLMYMGPISASLRDAYETAVLYDLRVLEEFLASWERDSIVIVMGDHQPPLVAPEATSFDVPMHIFARDPKWLTEFLASKFSPGLVLPGDRPAALDHAGIFSLLVRALLRGTTNHTDELPPFLPSGVKLAG